MSTDRKKFLSILTDRFFPQYIRDTYPTYVDFIRKYFEFLETDGQVYQLITDFLHIIDIDKIDIANETEILEQYIKQFLSGFPISEIDNITDVKRLIKNARNFYKTKGTETAYRFIFTILETLGDFEFYYPSDHILIISGDPYSDVLDGDKMIHDNEYHAFYTYELISKYFSFIDVKEIVENLLHPTGMKAFFTRIVESVQEYAPEAITNTNLYLAIGRTTPWTDEETPPDPMPYGFFSDVEELVAITKIVKQFVVQPYDPYNPNTSQDIEIGDLWYSIIPGVYVNDSYALYSPYLVYLEAEFRYNDNVPTNINFRQIGVISNPEKDGVILQDDFYLASDIDSQGTIIYVTNKTLIKRSEWQNDRIKILLEV